MLADDPTCAAAGCGDVRLLGRGADDEWVAGRTEDEVQQHRIGRERCAQVWECVVGEILMRIRTVGLDAAGDTAVSRELKQDGAASTIPTIGFNLESTGCENSCLAAWDAGSQDKIWCAWRQ